MKKLVIVGLIAALLLVLCGCQAVTTSPTGPIDGFEGWAEILMPGNTLVTGHYDQVMRISSGWMKIHVNGTWYAANEWRVVLKEDEGEKNVYGD